MNSAPEKVTVPPANSAPQKLTVPPGELYAGEVNEAAGELGAREVDTPSENRATEADGAADELGAREIAAVKDSIGEIKIKAAPVLHAARPASVRLEMGGDYSDDGVTYLPGPAWSLRCGDPVVPDSGSPGIGSLIADSGPCPDAPFAGRADTASCPCGMRRQAHSTSTQVWRHSSQSSVRPAIAYTPASCTAGLPSPRCPVAAASRIAFSVPLTRAGTTIERRSSPRARRRPPLLGD